MEPSRRAKDFKNAVRFECGPARIVDSTCMHTRASLCNFPCRQASSGVFWPWTEECGVQITRMTSLAHAHLACSIQVAQHLLHLVSGMLDICLSCAQGLHANNWGIQTLSFQGTCSNDAPRAEMSALYWRQELVYNEVCRPGCAEPRRRLPSLNLSGGQSSCRARC